MNSTRVSSDHAISEYLISVIPDTTNNTVLKLVDILHAQDISMNKTITNYIFHAYKLTYDGDNYKLTQSNASGTVYIYYISI